MQHRLAVGVREGVRAGNDGRGSVRAVGGEASDGGWSWWREEKRRRKGRRGMTMVVVVVGSASEQGRWRHKGVAWLVDHRHAGGEEEEAGW